MRDEEGLEEVRLSELADLAEVILKRLQEEQGVTEVSLENYYYWNLPAEQRYDVYETPQEDDFTIGDLNENLESLRGVLDGSRGPSTRDLVYLVELLRYIGEFHS